MESTQALDFPVERALVIGGGNMGGAFVRGMILGEVIEPSSLLVVERAEENREELHTRYGCVVSPALGSIEGMEVILLAIKPQDAEAVCEQLAVVLGPGQLVISCMAGVSLTSLSKKLGGHTTLIRCMPNIPVEIAQGVIAYTPYPGLPEHYINLAKNLFGPLGEAILLPDEDKIDIATAISGSGTGYVAYLVEHMMVVAIELGLSEEAARLMVTQTFEGGATYLSQISLTPQELRRRVTSPKGTTDRAITHFEKCQVGEALQQGIREAYKRAKELAQLVDK